MKHYEFLADGDGREELVKGLVSLIPEEACILAYNMKFEKEVIKNLAKQFPAYKKRLMNIHDNIKDLMVPFQKRHYYTKEMNGSYSLKYVLPALFGDLTYNGMAVANGDEAVTAYKSLPFIGNAAERGRERVRQDLLAYCKLDTYAMVKVLEIAA